MRKLRRASIAAIGLAFFFGVLAADEAQGQGILSTILARMDAHSKSLLSLKADIKLIKDFPQFEETDTYEGTITVLPKKDNRPRYVRIDWAKPRAENIAIRGENFESYVPAMKTITIGKATRSTNGGGLLDLLVLSKQQIKENYVIDYLGQEVITGEVETLHLRFTPKKRGFYKFTDIWVDGDGMPLQATESGHGSYVRPVNFERLGVTRAVMAMVKRTEEETGVKIGCEIEPVFEFAAETTTLRISNLGKNVTVEGSIFKINTPKGTKVIKG